MNYTEGVYTQFERLSRIRAKLIFHEMQIFHLTILYCISSIIARLESLSNMEMPKPSVFAMRSRIMGCSCLWSPIRTTWRAFELMIGTSDSSSKHIPHSSTMHCRMSLQDMVILGPPAVTHVHKMIWTPNDCSAHVSASPIN